MSDVHPLIVGSIMERRVDLDARAVDTTARTIPASLSSETPVRRWFGVETLLHTAEAVNLERAATGLPLLFGHDQTLPIGLIENVRLDGDRLRGTLRFSNNARAAEVFRDVADGFLRSLSIGYSVDRWEQAAGSDDITVTRWTPMEGSIVTVPADPTVGINRSSPLYGDTSMSDPKTPQAEIPAAEKDDQPVDLTAIRAEVAAVERARVAEIDALFSLRSVPQSAEMAALRTRAIADGLDPAEAGRQILNAMAADSKPILDYGTLTDRQTTVQHGEDARDKFARAAEEGMLVRSGMVTDPEARRRAAETGMPGKSLKTLAREWLRIAGHGDDRMTDEQVAIRALALRSPHGQTTSDFTYLLANVANKALMMGFSEAPETWQTWTRRGQLPDFKTADRINMSGFTGLAEVAEDGEISYGKFTDRKETIKLVQYAKKYRISRQLIINDDLGGLSNIPRAMGRAANRKIGDVVYAVLNGVGPTLTQDSIALWDTSTHKNYVAAATAPTVATLTTAMTAMAKQTDPNTGAALNVRARYLVVPVALEATARVLMASADDPAGATIRTPNPYAGRFEVVSDARLDGQTQGTTAWYLFADPNIFDTFEVAFLNGVDTPTLRENAAWDGQGIEYAVGIDFGVAALDFRAVHKYKGTT